MARDKPNPVSSDPNAVEKPSSKKRKRKEKHTEAEEDDAHELPTEEARSAKDGLKKKKKKRKLANEETLAEAEPALATTVEEQEQPFEGTSSDKKSKKKRKEKHKHRTADAGAADQSNNESTTSSNAFLSAVMTAAAAGQNLQAQSQVGYVFPPMELSHNQLGTVGLDGLNASLSSEDLARTLNSMDVAKIADALRALGDAGSSSFTLPGQPAPPHAMMQMGNHAASGSNQRSRSQAPRKASAAPAFSATPNLQPQQNETHADILSRKWLNTTKLNELSKEIGEGLVYKKGKFSASEIVALKQAIENYRIRNSLTPEQMNEVIFPKGTRNKDNAFWFDITSALPQRPVIAVYHYVRRSYHPMAQQGKWTEAEDDLLQKAVIELGQSWEKVSERVGRMSGDCRDRWRNHIHNREGRVFGAWTQEEEKRLTQIVTEMMEAQGKSTAGASDNDIFWTQVAERMGKSRGRQQCRIKWTDSLSKRVKNDGVKPRWNQQDAYILVSKIDAQNVNDDSEIDWKQLRDENWNLWSAHAIQRRWRTLKHSIRGHEEMSHQEIMDILRVKKGQPPPAPTGPSKRITSAPIVPVEAQANDVALDESQFMLPSAPPPGGFEEAGLAQDPYVLGPGAGPLDPNMHPHPFAGSFGAPATAQSEFSSTFPEAGPSIGVATLNGHGEAQEGESDRGSSESSDSENSDSD